MEPTSSVPSAAGRYLLERKLTEGGMAEVYLARKCLPGGEQKVVMKSLLPTFLDNKDYVAMMVNEARLAAGLSHPNIVRVEDLIDVDGRPFIVMEYLEGQTLRHIVHRALTEKRALPTGFVCRIIAKVLLGLHHAHDRADENGQALGLVHRDVSLANVIVTWTGSVKLIDFGIAKATQMLDVELTRAGQLKGKTAYMSPEQVQRMALDRRSDLFSVGVVLWEMLTRRRLFTRKNEVLTMMAIVNEDARPPSAVEASVPAELDRICAKALTRDREQRYQTAQQMSDELEALIAAQGWTVSDETLAAELASLFPEESAAAVIELTADDEEDLDAKMPCLSLYTDEEEVVTTLTPPAFLGAAPPPPDRRAPHLALFNQPIPGPTCYDDWGPTSTTVTLRRRDRGIWIALVSCLLLGVAAAAGVAMDCARPDTSRPAVATGGAR